jgi:hypothetical protein
VPPASPPSSPPAPPPPASPPPPHRPDIPRDEVIFWVDQPETSDQAQGEDEDSDLIDTSEVAGGGEDSSLVDSGVTSGSDSTSWDENEVDGPGNNPGPNQ